MYLSSVFIGKKTNADIPKYSADQKSYPLAKSTSLKEKETKREKIESKLE